MTAGAFETRVCGEDGLRVGAGSFDQVGVFGYIEDAESRQAGLAQAEQVAALLGPARRTHDVLFSSAILKKTGLRLRQPIA